jgi:hypothetical protein
MITRYAVVGAVDVLCRLVSQRLSDAMGQPLGVESRTAASAMIAADAVARSDPDGYTLLQRCRASSPSFRTRGKDQGVNGRFRSCGGIRRGVPGAAGKANGPGGKPEGADRVIEGAGLKLSCASPGIGTLPHLATELLMARIGAKALNVPYRSSAPALHDLMAGQVALQSLTPEVARANRDTRAAYEAELIKVVEAVAKGLSNGTLPARRKTAWAILSILSGGVSIARSAADHKTGSQIAVGVRGAILALTDSR